jgi:kynurenine formamidase
MNKYTMTNNEKCHSLAIGITFKEQHGRYYVKAAPNKDMLLRVNSGHLKSEQHGCNVSEIKLIPHCHGTHTESIAHIDDEGVTIDKIQPPLGVPCQLVSICGRQFDETSDSYPMHVNENEQVIDSYELKAKLSNISKDKLKAIVLRTLPNEESKKDRIYTNINAYPFLTSEAVNYIRSLGVLHLLVDTPSIDRLDDKGKLYNHRQFWGYDKVIENNNRRNRQAATITELVYASSEIDDGFYYLYLCYPMLKTDAVPSWPVLIKKD